MTALDPAPHIRLLFHQPRKDGDVQSPMLEIANAMVRLHKQAFARGPTKARAQFAGPDAIVVILEQTLTSAERSLVAMGEQERLRDARQLFQSAFETEFRTIVEHTLGRRTIGFVSGIDPHNDVAVEVFTLEPERGFSPSSAPEPSQNGRR